MRPSIGKIAGAGQKRNKTKEKQKAVKSIYISNGAAEKRVYTNLNIQHNEAIHT